MDRLRALLEQTLDFLRRGRVEAEMDEELRFHVEKEVESNVRAGMSPDEARRQALLAFGGTDWHKEGVRDERGGRVLEDLIRDLRFGLRNLGKRPVFALAAILTLSVGIGMTTTMFTLVDAVLLGPLPGANAEGMVYLDLASEERDVSTSPTPELLRLVRDHASSFSHVEAYTTEDFTLSVQGEPLRATGARASVGFFSFLGVAPRLGRGFVPDDGLGNGSPVVLLSHTLWVERFAEDDGVLGQTMGINGAIYEIIGVLPRDFRVDTRAESMFWMPEGAAGVLLAEGAPVEGALAKLAEGVSVDVARAELDAIVQNNPLEQLGNMEWIAQVHTPSDLIDPTLKRAILIFQAAALLVLLIGCGNLTNLLLAQGETRSRELALRASLGAGRGRLIRQLLVESLILGAFGGVGGILLTNWALDAFPLFLPPGYGGFALNQDVLLFATGASLLSVLAAGLLPALKGSNRDLGEVIKGSAAPPRGLLSLVGARQILVTAQVAMAFVLLVSAGLLLKSFAGLMAGNVGFDRENLLVVRLDLPEAEYPDAETQMAFFDQLQAGIQEGFPEQVGTATVASGLVEGLAATFAPLVPEGAEGAEEEELIVIMWGVAPGYFDVVGVPLLQGREFVDKDGRGGEDVVIINETVARRYFPDTDPVGRRLRLRDDWYRVVGVSGSVQLPSFARNDLGERQLFFPFRKDGGSTLNIIARIRGDRSTAIDLLKQAVWGIDGSLPIVDVSMVEDLLAESLAQERSNALLMILFALTALVLGAVGIYGVVAYSVSRRIREMGIRLALGATSGDVVRRVVMGGMTTVGLGMVLGAAGAAALGTSLSGLLVEVDARDPRVFLVVFLVTGCAALLATWLPARRATGGGPVDALRSE